MSTAPAYRDLITRLMQPEDEPNRGYQSIKQVPMLTGDDAATVLIANPVLLENLKLNVALLAAGLIGVRDGKQLSAQERLEFLGSHLFDRLTAEIREQLFDGLRDATCDRALAADRERPVTTRDRDRAYANSVSVASYEVAL